MANIDLQTAEADGAALAACAGITLSPMALGVEYDPWSTGSETYGDLAGTLQIAGEADGAASPEATPHYPEEGMQGEADGAAGATAAAPQLAFLNLRGGGNGQAATTGRFGGSLQIAGQAAATQTGGGTPTPIEATAPTSSQPAATINAGNTIATSQTDGAAAATGRMGIGTGTASAPGSATAAAAMSIRTAMHAASGGNSGPTAQPGNASTPAGNANSSGAAAGTATMILEEALAATQGGASAGRATLTDDPIQGAEAEGAATPSAIITVVASISGRSGKDGWESPQIEGEAGGASSPEADLNRHGQPTVQMAGSA